jgi:hypothetical protein
LQVIDAFKYKLDEAKETIDTYGSVVSLKIKQEE